MLEHLDVLIGLVAVMLGLSLVITIVNQFISSLLGLRGRSLHWGLSVLVHTLNDRGSGKPTQKVQDAVDEILSHPLVSDSQFPLFKNWQRATAIRFEEFIKMAGMLGDAANASETLQNMRNNNRITSTWFDSAMDRVSQQFAMQMRLITAAIGLLIAFTLPVDTIDLVNNLRNDQQLRAEFVAAADSVAKLNDKLPTDATEIKATAATLLEPLKKRSAPVDLSSLLSTPRPMDLRHFAGILLTAGLLSLGAPFWFHALKGLTSLRSVVANKTDSEGKAQSTPDVGDGINWSDR